MDEEKPTKEAEYNGKRVRAYKKGGQVFINQDDLDAITGHPRPGGEAGYENPSFDVAVNQARGYSQDFAFWLSETFSELTLTDYSDVDFSRDR